MSNLMRTRHKASLREEEKGVDASSIGDVCHGANFAGVPEPAAVGADEEVIPSTYPRMLMKMLTNHRVKRGKQEQ